MQNSKCQITLHRKLKFPNNVNLKGFTYWKSVKENIKDFFGHMHAYVLYLCMDM